MYLAQKSEKQIWILNLPHIKYIQGIIPDCEL